MFERALELDPKFAEARAWLGVSFGNMIASGYSNDPLGCTRLKRSFHRALDEDANSAVAYCGLSIVYFFQGRKELSWK